MDLKPEVNGGSKKYPLTLPRAIRGLACLLVYLSTSFLFLVYLGPFAAVFLRLFSIHYSRKLTTFLFGLWLALWPFLFEKINKTKVVFSGETVPKRERVLLIANHKTEVDWMYLWDLALRKGCIGCIKYVLKSSLLKLPVFGWGFHVLEFISVERKWEVDEFMMQKMLSTFTNPFDSLWLAIFPEGTDFSEEKCIKSQKFAAKNGLPVLKNVLLPKTRGFNVCLKILRGSLDAGCNRKKSTSKHTLGSQTLVTAKLRAEKELGCDISWEEMWRQSHCKKGKRPLDKLSEVGSSVVDDLDLEENVQQHKDEWVDERSYETLEIYKGYLVEKYGEDESQHPPFLIGNS